MVHLIASDREFRKFSATHPIFYVDSNGFIFESLAFKIDPESAFEDGDYIGSASRLELKSITISITGSGVKIHPGSAFYAS